MNYAIEEVENGKKVVIYLDMVPGNIGIQQIYQRLKVVSELNENRLLVIPIYGSEYLFIKAFSDLDIFKDKVSIQICLEKINYLDSPLYTSIKTRQDYRTFERYCKLILERNTINCACTSSRVLLRGYGYIKNTLKNYFYENDCKYIIKCNEILKVDDKIKRVLKCFDLIPNGNRLLEAQSCSWYEAWECHLEAIKELNNFIEEVKDRDELKGCCETFEPINMKH